MGEMETWRCFLEAGHGRALASVVSGEAVGHVGQCGKQGDEGVSAHAGTLQLCFQCIVTVIL